MPDHLGADHLALADDHLEHLGGQPRLDEQVTAPQGGQRGLGVGLHHDGVAGDEGRQGVADGEFEGVVPRHDLADDPARLAQLGDLRQDGDGAGVPLGPQVRGGLAAVVPGGQRDRLHLLMGVQPGLAGLHLDEVEHLGLAGQHQVVEAQQHGGAAGDRGGGPRLLRGTGPLEGVRDVLGGRLRQVGQLLAGERGVVGGPPGAHHVTGELRDHLGSHHVGRGAGPLGGRGEGVGAGARTGGLRLRHERERTATQRFWVPAGKYVSPRPHIAPAVTGTYALISGLAPSGGAANSITGMCGMRRRGGGRRSPPPPAGPRTGTAPVRRARESLLHLQGA